MYFFFWLGQITLPYFLRGREQKWYFCSGLLRRNVNFWRGLPQGKFSEEGTAKTPHQCRGDIRLPPAHWHRSIVTTIIYGQQVKELYYLIYYLLLSSLIKLIFINTQSEFPQQKFGRLLLHTKRANYGSGRLNSFVNRNTWLPTLLLG